MLLRVPSRMGRCCRNYYRRLNFPRGRHGGRLFPLFSSSIVWLFVFVFVVRRVGRWDHSHRRGGFMRVSIVRCHIPTGSESSKTCVRARVSAKLDPHGKNNSEVESRGLYL